ncbi:basic amino acid transporter SCDLUD_002981 [Saccharomycodes ludwigii]|uniref:basic amino acid transporter n=1 Tax=Saccharomycodes ludwigii TaxID=36035 RepID=UPI001E8AE92B|nr:hypothetical protein SCDLUD_002981 [Saccharomycodes ludwigii]KAH3901485.1 hypothetical protein SCDLUD_002981 [Saccharomycodes ludwigii]
MSKINNNNSTTKEIEIIHTNSILSNNDTSLLHTQNTIEGQNTKPSHSKEANAEHDEYYYGVKLFTVVASLCLILFLAALDIIIVSTCIEQVSRQFNDYSKSGWMVTGYSLPSSVFSLLWGRISAKVGTKISLSVSIFIFELGSLIAAVATSMNMLIGGRIIAGVGGSGIQTLCFIVISQIVPEFKRGFIISIMSITFAIASIAGPFIGGAFTTHVTWRWCFYVNLPIGGLAFVLFYFSFKFNSFDLQTCKNLPATVGNFFKSMGTRHFYYRVYYETMVTFDIPSFILSTAGFTLFLLGLTFAGGDSFTWNSGAVITLLTLGGILVILSFIYDYFIFEKFTMYLFNDQAPRFPLITKSTINNFSIVCTNLTNFLVSGFFISANLYIIQYFQLIFNNTAWKAGVHMIPMLVANCLTVPTLGIVNKKTGILKPFIVLASMLGIIGSGILCLFSVNSNSSDKIGFLILPGIAFGGVVQTTLIAVQAQIDKTKPFAKMELVSLTSIYSLFKLLGMAFGGIFSNMIFDVSLLNKVSANPSLSVYGMNIDEIISYRGIHFDGHNSLLAVLLNESIRNVYYMCIGLCGLGFLFSLFISNKKTAHERSKKESKGNTEKREEEKEEGEEEEEESQQEKNVQLV